MSNDFASWLKGERQKLGITGKEMALMLGIGARRYWYWETGREKKGPSVLEEMGVRALLSEPRAEECEEIAHSVQ